MTARITSEYLLQRLRELLDQKPVRSLSVSDFTQQTVVSRSTVYRYFPGGMLDLYQTLFLHLSLNLKQHEIDNWSRLVQHCVHYVDCHRLRSLNFYQLAHCEFPRQFWLNEVESILINFFQIIPQKALVSRILEKNPYELDFIAGGLLYHWDAWFENNLVADPQIVIQKLIHGYQYINYQLQNETIQL